MQCTVVIAPDVSDCLQTMAHKSLMQERYSCSDHLQHGSQMQRLWHNTRILLSNPEAVPFFAMSLLMGFGVGVLSTYLFLYLDELGELMYIYLQHGACFVPLFVQSSSTAELHCFVVQIATTKQHVDSLRFVTV